MKIARLLVRLIVGGLFVGHGTQKLFGWFGGHGIKGTGQFFESLGMRPGHHHATAAGVAETTGGALLITGFATPVAAAMLTATMLTAINRVHLKNGPWASDGGYEYNLVLIAIVLVLAEEGPGSLALGGEKLRGPGWALAALAGGVGGAVGAHLYAESQAEPEPAMPAQQAAAAAAAAAPDVAQPAG
ncbi:MAG TPA: DoxX family protein [Solirubrobacteraceae bacterium]